MILGVGNVETSVGGIGHALGTIQRIPRRTELRSDCGTAVTRITQLARSGDSLQAPLRWIDREYLIAFAKDQVHGAVRSNVDGAWAAGRCSLERAFVGSGRCFACSGKSGNNAGLRVDFSYAIVHDVADVDVVRFIERDAVRLRQLRLVRGPAIATVTADAGARGSRDDPGFHVDVSHNVAVSFSNKYVALAVKA